MGPKKRRMLVLTASFLDGAASVFGFPTMADVPAVTRRDPRQDARRIALDMRTIGLDLRRAIDDEARRRGA